MSADREVVFLHGGSSSQLATLGDLVDEGFRVREAYLPDLLEVPDALGDVSRLFVADRLHPRLWKQIADRAVGVARRGGLLFVSGENSVERVPGFDAASTPTNFWWWKHGEDPHIYLKPSSHPLRVELPDRALRWHYHAVLETPPAAEMLVTHESQEPDGPRGALLAIDESTTAGTIVVTTMDPVYHHGARFMPGASELLRGVMRWLSTSPLPDRQNVPAPQT